MIDIRMAHWLIGSWESARHGFEPARTASNPVSGPRYFMGLTVHQGHHGNRIKPQFSTQMMLFSIICEGTQRMDGKR